MSGVLCLYYVKGNYYYCLMWSKANSWNCAFYCVVYFVVVSWLKQWRISSVRISCGFSLADNYHLNFDHFYRRRLAGSRSASLDGLRWRRREFERANFGLVFGWAPFHAPAPWRGLLPIRLWNVIPDRFGYFRSGPHAEGTCDGVSYQLRLILEVAFVLRLLL